MNTRAATIAGLIAVGLIAAPAQAHATKPGIGNYCTKSEALDLRHTENGQPVACVYLGANGGFQWVATAKVDPVVREKGQRCTNAYPVARNRRGKALMCVQGEWSVGP